MHNIRVIFIYDVRYEHNCDYMVRLVSGIYLKVAMYEPEHVVRMYISYQI
jgi:hypothetical protein